MKTAITALILLASSGSLIAQDGAQGTVKLDPLLPYQAERSNAVTYDVDFSIVVTPPDKSKKLKVWLPVPTSDTAQEVSNRRLSSFPMVVEPRIATESKFGNRFAYFEFDSPKGAQIIRHQFRIKVWELHWNVDPTKVLAVSDWPSSFDKFRQGDTQAVVVDQRFNNLLDKIVPDKTNPAEGLDGIMIWVQENLQYDHHDASLRASSEHALTRRRGHCSDYHSFCAALGRVLGVPTRVTYGINPFPKNSPSHCKLEAFLAPYGWVSFDVSETQKLVGEIRKSGELDDNMRAMLIQRAEDRLAGGFRDNTWFLQTRGTDYDLAPPASKRVAVVRTAYIEADGAALSEPDPADKTQKSFSWMTVHEYRADRTVPYPFTDWHTLQPTEDK
jgi:transglutaminase-like putative cysteine protease